MSVVPETLVIRTVAAGICQDPVFECPPFPYCQARATVSYSGGCVHEHVFTVRKCDAHAEAVRLAESATGGLYCGPCQDSGHRCPVTLVWAVL